jgi:elongation factor Ts
MANIDLIKNIREQTGLSFKDIKNAIDHVGSDDQEKIITYLREQGALKVQGRQDRQTAQGRIFSYVHEGRIGVMIELRCETDFVSRGEVFAEAGKNFCLHVAASQPKFLKPEEASQEWIEKELEIAKTQLLEEGKPEEKIGMILEGKRKKMVEEVSLLTQPYLMDPKKTITDMINELSQATGEKVELSRYITFVL